jgi:hypothetical protein
MVKEGKKEGMTTNNVTKFTLETFISSQEISCDIYRRVGGGGGGWEALTTESDFPQYLILSFFSLYVFGNPVVYFS